MINTRLSKDTKDVSTCEEIEKKAVAWLVKSLKYFDPQNCFEDDRQFAHKAIVELALLAAYRRKLNPDKLDADDNLILEHIDKIAARPSYYEVIARDHRALLLYGLTYTALSICGLERDDFRWVTEQTVNARFPLILERIPYRQLDLLHFLYISNIEYDGPKLEDIFPLTILAGDPNVIELADTDVYAITHTLFYMTDFGLRAASWNSRATLDFSLEIITALIRIYRVNENADIVAELLACLICLGALDSPEISKALRFLRSVQQPDGLIAGPPGIISNSKGKTVDDFDYNQWRTSYHTTIVAALAARMLRRSLSDDSYPVRQNYQSQTSSGAAARRSESLIERCGQAIASSARWFTELSSNPDISVSLRALAGLSICMKVSGASAETQSASQEFGERMEEIALVSWSAYGFDTLALIAYGLQSSGRNQNGLGAMINELATNLDADVIIENPSILPSAAFFSHMNALDKKIALAAASKIPPLQFERLDGETILESASRTLQLSGGDPKLVSLESNENANLKEEVYVELQRACNEYRLGDAALLVRLLVLVGEKNNRLTRDAVDYLLSQQYKTGAFGYFASDSYNQQSLNTHIAWTLGITWAFSDFAYPEKTATNLFSL